MRVSRRNFLSLAAGAAALPAASRRAVAQAYPVRPVRLLVGFSAGSASDIVARLIGLDSQRVLRKPQRVGDSFLLPSLAAAIGVEGVRHSKKTATGLVQIVAKQE